MKLKGWLSPPKLAQQNDPEEDRSAADQDVANTEERTPVVLILDLSGSMRSQLGELESAFTELLTGARSNPVLDKVVDLAVIACSGDQAEVQQPFDRLANIRSPKFVAAGKTPLYGGIALSVRLIEDYREETARCGVDTRPPMVVVITDGNPSDEENKLVAITQVTRYERQPVRSNRIGFFFFATTGGNIEALQKLSKRPVKQVSSDSLRGIMDWILATMDSMSTTQTDEETCLPNPSDFMTL